MSTAELRAAAERLVKDDYGCCDDNKTFQDAEDVARAYLAEHKADDDEPVTPEWMESLGFGDTMNIRYTRRYEICRGIRIICFAVEGGWRSELWTGDGQSYEVKDPTRGDVRRLCKALDIELKEQP